MSWEAKSARSRRVQATSPPLANTNSINQGNQSSDSQNSSLHITTFPNLILGDFESAHSYSNPKNQKAEKIFTMEMDLSSARLKKKFLFDGKKDEVNKKYENFWKQPHPDSFFVSIRPVLYIMQAFALLPISGFTGRNADAIRFQWRSWRVFHVFFNFSGVIFLGICSLIHGLSDGLTYDGAAPIIFYVSAAIGTLLFLNLARSWASVCQGFAATEDLLGEYGYPKKQGRKFFVITLIFFFCALVEHSLSKLVDLIKALPCAKDDENNYDVTYTFFYFQYRQVFTLINFNIFLGVCTLYFNFTATVCWNIMDLFLGLMGISISVRLKQINQNLKSVLGKEKSSQYWKTVREQFNAISILTKEVDYHIQRIMLLSLGDNLFFICLQLLKSLKKRENAYQTVYFFWSFGFLLLRTCFVTLCASGVFDESREGKTVLYSVPQDCFCQEVRRFLTQLSTDELTLTGCRFFSVTRGLMLTIAGTIVTYEIVLVQFKSAVEPDEWPSNSTHASCAKLPI